MYVCVLLLCAATSDSNATAATGLSTWQITFGGMDSDEDEDGGEDTETDPDMWTDLRYKRVMLDWKVGAVKATHRLLPYLTPSAALRVSAGLMCGSTPL